MPRPRRSLLFMPGSNPRALEKARALPADGLIFDLEDAVAPVGERGGARAAVAWRPWPPEAMAGASWCCGSTRSTPRGAHADLAAAATMPIDAVLLPKVESARPGAAHALALLDALGAPRRLGALVHARDAGSACSNARDIAAADARGSPRWSLGTSDLTKDLHALAYPRPPAAAGRARAGILGGRAHGLAALDGVHLDLADDDGLRRSPAGRGASSASTARP